MSESLKMGDNCSALVKSNKGDKSGLGFDGSFIIECRDSKGLIKWTEDISNIVVNAGLDYFLDIGINSGTQITTWYVGLTDGTPTTAASDTMASHAGWLEITAYSEGTRQGLTLASTASQSVTNSANPAAYSINGTATTGGCFIVSDSAKNGTAGTLVSVGAFSGGDKAVTNGDTLNVTYTLSSSDV